jgi:hypothetical protein
VSGQFPDIPPSLRNKKSATRATSRTTADIVFDVDMFNVLINFDFNNVNNLHGINKTN